MDGEAEHVAGDRDANWLEPQPDDKRYARRNRKGQFAESDDVGRSLSQDRQRKAKRVVP
jgi:hypothetical protein